MEWLIPTLTALVVFVAALRSLVDWNNLQHSRSAPIPPDFQQDFSEEKRREAVRYLEANTHFTLLSRFFHTSIGLAFLWGGGFAALDQFASLWGFGPVVTGLLYFLALGVLSEILSLPFSWYATFVLEERFGFNRSTGKTFLLDQCKGWFLTLLLGGPVLGALLWFFLYAGGFAWFWAWAFLAVFQLVMVVLAPVLLMPLFNRFTPLEEGPLKAAIEGYAAKVGFQLQGVFTMDGSKRSSKANAFFTGLGRYRRIVLFDTLVKQHSIPELVAVLAHEVGHYKKGHIGKGMLLSLGSSFVLFFGLSLVLGSPSVSAAFGFAAPTVQAGFTAALWLYGPFSLLLGGARQYFSRKHEFEADAFAVETTGSGQELAGALKRLSRENLSNLTPHPWKVWLEYSHPPLVERLKALPSKG